MAHRHGRLISAAHTLPSAARRGTDSAAKVRISARIRSLASSTLSIARLVSAVVKEKHRRQRSRYAASAAPIWSATLVTVEPGVVVLLARTLKISLHHRQSYVTGESGPWKGFRLGAEISSRCHFRCRASYTPAMGIEL